eukprot:458003_1
MMDQYFNFSMMDQYLRKLTQRDKKLLLKISRNILNHPNVTKYHSLNIDKISQRRNSASTIVMNILYMVGFCKSDDGSRLIFKGDIIILDRLRELYILLQSECFNDDNNEEKNSDYQVLNDNFLSEMIEMISLLMKRRMPCLCLESKHR